MRLYARVTGVGPEPVSVAATVTEGDTVQRLLEAFARRLDKRAGASHGTLLVTHTLCAKNTRGKRLKPTAEVGVVLEAGDEVAVVAKPRTAADAATPAAPTAPPAAATPKPGAGAGAGGAAGGALSSAAPKPRRAQPPAAHLLGAAKDAAAGAWANADALWQGWLDMLDADHVPSLRGRGAVALSTRRPADAVPFLHRAVAVWPNHVPTRVHLGHALLRSGSTVDALTAFDEALGRTLEDGDCNEPEEVWCGVDPESGLPFPRSYDTRDVMALCARALIAVGERDRAVSVLTKVLQDHDSHVDALILYASECEARGKMDSAMALLLKAVVAQQNNRVARRAVAGLVAAKGGFECLKDQLAPSPSTASAFAFIALLAKEWGELPVSCDVYALSCELDPNSHSLALNYIHALECMGRYQEAFDAIKAHLRRHKAARLNAVPSSLMLEALQPLRDVYTFLRSSDVPVHSPPAVDVSDWAVEADHIADDTRAGLWDVTWKPKDPPYAHVVVTGKPDDGAPDPVRCDYDGDALDLLAIWFTAVKIVHACGALPLLPRLVQIVERVRRGKPLHLTAIRNENAYYCCVAQLIQYLSNGVPELVVDARVSVGGGDAARGGGAGAGAGVGTTNVVPRRLPRIVGSPSLCLPQLASKPVYVCGDSHSLSPSWHTVEIHGRERLLVPALVTGLKAWHLRPESTFYPKYNYHAVTVAIPDGAEVVMVFCEIDCREGLLVAVSRGYYPDLQAGINKVVRIYMSALLHLVRKRGMTVHVHPVLPVLKETRGIVKQFNATLKRVVQDKAASVPRLHWLDIFPSLLTPDGSSLRPEFELDGTHISPQYLPLLVRGIEAATTA